MTLGWLARDDLILVSIAMGSVLARLPGRRSVGRVSYFFFVDRDGTVLAETRHG